MKMTIALFLLLSFSVFVVEARAQETRQNDTIKIDTNLVSVPVVVSDRQGRYVPGLKAEDFSLYQDGKKQTISFFGAEEEPLNVALLLDTSYSALDALGAIQDAADDFIRLLQPADRAMVMTFDHTVNVLCPLTSDHKRLQKAVNQVDIGERLGTVMRDAALEVIERSFAKVNGRKAIILLTDGMDHGSSISKDELLDRLEESDVMVYSVLYKTRMGSMARRRGMGRRGGRGGGGRGGVWFPGGGGRDGGGRGGRNPGGPRRGGRNGGGYDREEDAIEYAKQMAEVSGGRYYQKDVTDLNETFALIADELRKHYRLGYYPPDAEGDSITHKISVKVARNDLSVRSRSSYRAK
jgi:VWFA-related protein